MREVALAQPYVPTYSLPFFDGLVARLAADDVNLSIYHSPGLSQAASRNDLEQPSWSVAVPARELSLGGRAVVMRRLPAAARRADLLILEQALGKVDALLLLAPRRRRPIAMMGHGHIYNRVMSSAEQSLLQRLTGRADWFFGYTPSARDDALVAGVPADRITVFDNSTDTVTLSTHRRSVTAEEVDATRDRLGLGSGPVLLFVGSIDESKRPEFLLEAMAHVWNAHPDASLVLVGDGSAADQLRTASGRVVHAGRQSGRPLAVLAGAATVLVMPGRVGLVATDSFALELPIVTTSWTFHSPEFAYLTDGVNAVVTDDDPSVYASAVVRLIERPDEVERLREGCRASADRYTTANMVQRFGDGVLAALEAGPRPSGLQPTSASCSQVGRRPCAALAASIVHVDRLCNRRGHG